MSCRGFFVSEPIDYTAAVKFIHIYSVTLLSKKAAPDTTRRGLNPSCISFCILKQNTVFEDKKAVLQTLSRFKKVRKNGHIPGVSQYMAVFAMKSAGDSDTNAHPCRIGGASVSCRGNGCAWSLVGCAFLQHIPLLVI